ncbi:MAG: HAD-IA family hydrolase [Bacteroidota bacterium]
MKSTTKITTISFDGDMTLWDFNKVMRHSLAITLEELRKQVPSKPTAELTIDKMIAIRNEVSQELEGQTINLEEIRLQAFNRTLDAVGYKNDRLAIHLNNLYLKHRFEDIELYPDVLTTLHTLQKDYRLGLISNGNGYPEKCGLPDFFSFVIFSQDVGIKKPNPKIFSMACKKANCLNTELLHIGDSLESDVQGANAARVLSVWLNRDGLANNTTIKPAFEIQSLNEISDILKYK